MAEVIFGPVAVLGWMLASACFTFCATYVWLIVWQLGGIRGTALRLSLLRDILFVKGEKRKLLW